MKSEKTSKGYMSVEAIRNDIVHVSFSKKEIKRNNSLLIENTVCSVVDEDCLILTTTNSLNSSITFTNSETGEVFLKEKKKTLVETPVYKYTTER